MTIPARDQGAATEAIAAPAARGHLFRKYVALLMAVVTVALAANSLFDIWFTYHEQKALLIRIQRGQAEAVAQRISQFISEIEGQMAWATQLPWSADTLDEWRFDAVRLLRQVPAVTEVAQLDETGREQARMSRHAMDVVGSATDFSTDSTFLEAIANKVYHGPVYFLRESEPYMTLAMAGTRREYGVIVAQVNLKFIWDVVSQIKVGERGLAFVVDAEARLIAHPDISLVLRNTDFSRLAHVQAARSTRPEVPLEQQPVTDDILGHQVLSAHALVAPLGWLVFVELPVNEAFAPIYASILRAGMVVLAALVLAFFGGLFFANRMVVPIRALHEGAARLGSGDLAQRISIRTGDELEALGDQFNSMAARLQDSYATLERKVEERTQQLELANLAKSRFLAAASHDLRQPLHALGLFVAQLHARMNADELGRLVERIDAALAAMNELFNALLDISKLDSGTMAPNKTEFPMERLLKRIESTFAGQAREKGLQLRVVASKAWVCSDFILLERILFNLVSNAVRYTSHGAVLVGSRKRDGELRIEVWDTGAGIPADEHQNIFGEFYRVGEPDRDRRAGLGLGLAIVDRLCRLLEHPIGLTSTVGKGTRFTVTVPQVAAKADAAVQPVPARAAFDLSKDKLIVVVDDDPLVRDGMGGLFRSWGFRVVTGGTDGAALTGLAQHGHPPDLIISDYRLPDGTTGVQVIERLRSAFCTQIPAFLISGDTNPEPLRDARASGFHLLHKPVDAMTLRAVLNQALRKARSVPVQ
jgi:signal transduction histidine kinase/ActR/RegA family two-component response regulator